MAYIELKNIQKSFADGNGNQRTLSKSGESGGMRKVLDGLDLTVEQGEIVAVTGVSGTGKTTLLNILGTLLQPDGGIYQLGGERINYENEHRLLQLRNQQIGFMFQDYRLLPQLTAWQNILLPTLANGKKPSAERMWRGTSVDTDDSWAEELVQKMGIGDILQQLPETLSGGEKSRVALCRALIMRPNLLLADEPTGQLDSQHANEVAQLLKTVNEQMGMTIVLVTHSEKLASAANSIYELKNGILTY